MEKIKKACGVFVALSAATTAYVPVSAQQASKPNVLMIVVDDWGANDLSFAGSKFYETQNIDQLSEQSTTFSQAYVAYPRSVPSRYSLITGRHCARPQQGAKGDDRKVDAQSYCIAEPFKAAGYSTFIIGKWHLSDEVTNPEDKGFDVNIGAGHAGATGTYFAPFNKKGVSDPDRLIYGMDDAVPGEYLTDYMVRKTVDYIKADRKNPFFVICSFYAVHTPLEAKPDLIKKYEQKKIKLGLGVDNLMPEEAGFRKTQQDHPVYAAMIESVDQGVGRMVDALKATGQYDNTIIVIISDHGGLSNRGQNTRELATTNAPLKAGKGHLYEGGLRVPLLVHLPKQKQPVRKDECVVSYDLLPTLTDLCELSNPKTAQLDGISFKPILFNKPQENLKHRDLYWHKVSERPNSTGDYVSTVVRSGNYKLIDFYTQGRIELYDLKNDPGETHNLKNEKPELAEQLVKKINSWRQEYNVYMPHNEKMKSLKTEKKRNKNKRAKIETD